MAGAGQAEKTPATEEQGTVVEFVGVKPFGREFHRERSISKKEFDAVTISASQDYVFNPDNGWKVRVPASDTDVLEYFKKDESFKVSV